MNRRCVIALLTLSSLFGRYSAADTTPDSPVPDITSDVKQTASSHADDIGQAIHGGLDQMVQHPLDPKLISGARDWFAKNAEDEGNPGYQGVYVQEINKAFVDLLSKPETPASVRLNMAIITSDLEGKVHGQIVGLADAVEQLLADKSVVVALQAEKAAKLILIQGANLQASARDALIKAVVKAVADHPNAPDGVSLAEEAYKAIDPAFWPPNAFPNGANLSAFIDGMLDLQKLRVNIYRTTGVPENPYADTYASAFLLGNAQVWGAMSQTQQLQAIQQTADLISLGSQRLQGTDEELNRTLSAEGKWIGLLSSSALSSDPATVDAAKALEGVTPGTSPDDVRKNCDTLLTALKAAVASTPLGTLQDPVNLSSPGNAPQGAAAAQ
jgi:hypothetical protein